LVHFAGIWYILWLHIWYIFPILVCCTKNNLATLLCVPAEFSGVLWTTCFTIRVTRLAGYLPFGQLFSDTFIQISDGAQNVRAIFHTENGMH
jgi:hypothetical protein